MIHTPQYQKKKEKNLIKKWEEDQTEQSKDVSLLKQN